MSETILERVKEVIVDATGVDVDSLPHATRFTDHVDIVWFAMACEKEFQITLSERDYLVCTFITDIGDFVKLIEERQMTTITINGQPIKKLGDLDIGEHGYINGNALNNGELDMNAPVYPVLFEQLYNHFAVTRTRETSYDLVTCGGDEECLVVESDPRRFEARVSAALRDGWELCAESLRVTPECYVVALSRVKVIE